MADLCRRVLGRQQFVLGFTPTLRRVGSVQLHRAPACRVVLCQHKSTQSRDSGSGAEKIQERTAGRLKICITKEKQSRVQGHVMESR